MQVDKNATIQITPSTVPPQRVISTDGGEQSSTHHHIQAPVVHDVIDAPIQDLGGETQSLDERTVVIQGSSFSLYKDVDGKIRSKVVNKETGEVTYTPPLDSYSFYQAISGEKGLFFEEDV